MSSERNNPNPRKPETEGDKPKPGGWLALTVALVLALAVSSIYSFVMESQYTEKSWTEFRADMTAGIISEAEIDWLLFGDLLSQ